MHEEKIYLLHTSSRTLRKVLPISESVFCQTTEIKSNVKTFFGDKIENYIEEQLKRQVDMFSLTTKRFC